MSRLYDQKPFACRFSPRLVGDDCRPVERRDDNRNFDLLALALVGDIRCAIRDRSSTGARLEIERDAAQHDTVAADLPNLIRLNIPRDNWSALCRVVWRDGRHFGVDIIGEVRELR